MTEDGRKNYLFIINDSAYGNERPYNALRLAMNLAKLPDVCVQVFLMGDGVSCAAAGQKTPNGYYNVERMLQSIARQGEVPPEGRVQRPAGSGQKSSSKGTRRATWRCWRTGPRRPTRYSCSSAASAHCRPRCAA